MGFLCPSNEAMIRGAAKLAEQFGRSYSNIDSVRAMVRALDGQEPYLFTAENVMRHNSLQVSYAERNVFSRDDNFSLVREMIANNPENRSGPRFTVA